MTSETTGWLVALPAVASDFTLLPFPPPSEDNAVKDLTCNEYRERGLVVAATDKILLLITGSKDRQCLITLNFYLLKYKHYNFT